jgi:two-component system response regulator LytT
MNIIIIEDEPKTAQSLESIIQSVRPGSVIVGRYQSIESSVKALSEGVQADLIFMDIQLADGLSFEIFKSVHVTAPVVFCTAFGDYSLEAFKSNGIDYVLKPFSRTDIQTAFKKVEELKSHFQQKALPNLDDLLSKLNAPVGKTSFLVFKDQKYTNVSIENIAYFSIRNGVTWIVGFDKQKFTIDQSLEQVESSVSPKQFFRVNRQYLVNFRAIRQVEHYFLRKLLVTLTVETPEKILINKEKAPAFLTWMEDR